MKKKFFAILAFCGSAVFAADVVEVKVVAMDGFGGDSGSVLSRCQTKKGAVYDPVTVTRDVATLDQSGEFEDVRVDAKEANGGVEVTFFVHRKLRYHSPVEVVGCAELSESKIASEAGFRDGYFYGLGDFSAAASRIRSVYAKRGFHEAKVEAAPRIIGSANDCTVVFTIEEGEKSEFAGYSFLGVENVEERELREAIGDLPWWNPVGWFNDSPTTDEQLAQAVAQIAEVYRNRGYLDVKVADAQRIKTEDGRQEIVFAVSEGMRYAVGESSIAGLTRYSEDAVKEKSALPPAGEVASAKSLADAANRIKVAVGSGDSGLADTRVEVRHIPVGSNVVDIVYQVTEGVPVVIDEVVIRGNDYTKDKVIRREIALGPGDRMLEDRAQRSQRRLENLDYFSRVRYSLEATGRGQDATGAEYRNLVYEVEEKNTGSFMVGVGASSVDSVYVSAEVSQSNFDLFAPSKFFRGGGQKGRAYVQWGPRIQTIEASVTEPYFLDRMLELTVEGYRRGRWYDEYDLYRTGGDVGLSYPVKFSKGGDPFGRLGFRLTGEFISFDDVDSGYYLHHGREVQYFREQERKDGDAAEGVFRVYWSRDNRDNFRIPTTGSRTLVFADIAGGDNSYWKVGVNHRHYFTTWKRFGHVFMVGLRAETMDALSGDVAIYDRLFLGGPRSIRGIKYRNVSPLIKSAYGGDAAPIGGQTLFCMDFEYTIPVVKMLRFAVFSDLGSVGEDEFDLDFSDTFAWTVGAGARLDIPMFPIRLDFGIPVKEPENSEKEVFSFMVGYDF